MRRDEFAVDEYHRLHAVGRRWIAEAARPSRTWRRTRAYNMILIACDAGMEPVEMTSLRWRDVMLTKGCEGRELAALFVQGKGKSRSWSPART